MPPHPRRTSSGLSHRGRNPGERAGLHQPKGTQTLKRRAVEREMSSRETPSRHAPVCATAFRKQRQPAGRKVETNTIITLGRSPPCGARDTGRSGLGTETSSLRIESRWLRRPLWNDRPHAVEPRSRPSCWRARGRPARRRPCSRTVLVHGPRAVTHAGETSTKSLHADSCLLQSV